MFKLLFVRVRITIWLGSVTVHIIFQRLGLFFNYGLGSYLSTLMARSNGLGLFIIAGD